MKSKGPKKIYAPNGKVVQSGLFWIWGLGFVWDFGFCTWDFLLGTIVDFLTQVKESS
jgi:hypothetical protein